MTLSKKEQSRKYYLKNREKLKAKSKITYRKNKDKHVNYRRKSAYKIRYGITLEQYNQMFEKQKGKCAICKRHQKDLTTTLCVDHNHKTKQVRGLLCVTCNTDVSVVENRLKEMLRYLNKYRKDVN